MKKFICFSLLALSLLGANSASALDQAACTYKDLRIKLGPVRNQGDVGWCYANTAADLLTAHFKLKSEGFMSAVQLAMIYNFSYEDSLNSEGGDIAQTLKLALRNPRSNESSSELLKFGYCPNSLEQEAMTIGPKTSLRTKIARLNELKKLYDEGKANPIKKKSFWDLYLGYKSQGSILIKIPEVTFLNALERSTPSNFLLKFADIICGDARYYNEKTDIMVIKHGKVVNATYTYNQGPSCSKKFEFNLLPEIHRELNNERIIGVGFNSSLIEMGGSLDKDSIGHAAVILGRQWKNGSCQVLMRNSWGTACDFQDEKGRKFSRYSKYVQECDQGNLWLKEQDLEKAISSMTYIVNGTDLFPQQIPPPEVNQCRAP